MTDADGPAMIVVDEDQAGEVLTSLFNGLSLLWAGANGLTFRPEESQFELAWNRLLHRVSTEVGAELIEQMEMAVSRAVNSEDPTYRQRAVVEVQRPEGASD